MQLLMCWQKRACRALLFKHHALVRTAQMDCRFLHKGTDCSMSTNHQHVQHQQQRELHCNWQLNPDFLIHSIQTVCD